MNDKELLELAAKAAGIDLQEQDDGSPGYYGEWRGLPQWEHWNPLTNDGDALRLAVKLHLKIEVLNYGCSARQKTNDNWQACPAHLYGGIGNATRRAIVLAASEIGRSLP